MEIISQSEAKRQGLHLMAALPPGKEAGACINRHLSAKKKRKKKIFFFLPAVCVVQTESNAVTADLGAVAS